MDRVEVADCRVWLGELPEDFIDLLMTSPPYWSPHNPQSFAGIIECVWDGNADCKHEWSYGGRCANCGAWKGELGLEPTQKMYITHLLDIFTLVKKALKPTGSFYLNLGDTRSSTPRRTGNKRVIPHLIEQGMLNDGWVLIDKSAWRKPNTISSSQERRPKYSFELLFHFVKNTKTLLWHNVETGEWTRMKPLQRYRNLKTDMETRWEDLGTTMPPIMKAPIMNMTPQQLEERRLWRRVWQPFAYYYDLDAISGVQGDRKPVRIGNDPKTRIAGTLYEAFPEEFCVRPILSSCPPEGIAVDPFAGSGTTLLVAKKLGRHYLGCDLNPDYVKMARKRLAAIEAR